jgi:hypothetical protein
MNHSDSLFLEHRKDVESTLTAIEILGAPTKLGRKELIDQFQAKHPKPYTSKGYVSKFLAGIFDNKVDWSVFSRKS